MSKTPFYSWYMPYKFEVHSNDCALLDRTQVAIRLEILMLYWRRNCELEYKQLPRALNLPASQIKAVFNLCPGLEVVDGKVHHEQYKAEFVRVLRQSKRGSEAARIRWASRQQPDSDSERAE